jgi:hypothetical protein
MCSLRSPILVLRISLKSENGPGTIGEPLPARGAVGEMTYCAPTFDPIKPIIIMASMKQINATIENNILNFLSSLIL